jgi:nucleotide-binding universal stress UspA family protein
MKTILAPIDFSPVTSLVVDEAARLAKAMGGRVALVHVARVPPAASEYGMELGSLTQFTATIEQTADRQLKEIEEDLLQRGVTTESVRVTGSPTVDILDQATKLAADYIVIGSHGHTAFYDLVIGSTASAVIKRAKCPVIVVPSPKRAAIKERTTKRAAADALARS